MDILLINPDHKNRKNNTPWGVLALGSYLRKVEGVDVHLFDASIEGADAAYQTLPDLMAQARVIGIGAFSSDAPFIKRVADMAKQLFPDKPLILGGPHANLYPEQSACYKNIDYVAYGDGEATTAALLKAAAAGSIDPAKIPGLCYQQADGTVVRTPPQPIEPFFDIDYDLLDPRVRHYFGKYIQVLAGRGCPFRCTFCYVSPSAKSWQGRSIESLFEQLDALIAQYDSKVVYFRDELFFHDKQRIRDFIRLYRERNYHFKWRASCRASDFGDNFITQEMVQDLAEVGCSCLKMGFESGSDTILKAIKKGIKVKNIQTAVTMLAKQPEIQINCSFIMGFPQETPADYRATMQLINWIRKQATNFYMVGPQYYRVYPGGALYEEVISQFDYQIPPTLDAWSERYLDPGNKDAFTDQSVDYPWVPVEMRPLAQQASFLVALACMEQQIGYMSRYKKRLLAPFVALARLRLNMGWYGYLVDLKMARGVVDFSIWAWADRSPLLNGLKKRAWFNALRQTPLYRKFSALFT
ncbi:Radical SAM domain protein [Magnetococcus marinus MC-1]|uniref:Radical SAM domain protein n=1 Tax=Magnetococcus marinus (strain ATCC BAA-1437 / JCM 17883 / MC-1) TaxID=156889 RepID=A0L6P1_MAGMM|nr:radical SAM protein [Magnetococcus marinus]ABK43634.1 Radical SAM domain protein [Magnetococcus marinus MC-1]